MEKTKDLYRDLLSVFDKLILPTHASYHVQYTLFYLCSFRMVSTSHTVHEALCDAREKPHGKSTRSGEHSYASGFSSTQ